ncbi:hypothetical protein ASZ90_008940 [hydrocarbon metagenome]|uniref:Uncharacterized protein n=1 Tax=hydrocarbon metagenome TaxID=938273 RepID=A0A0W8FK55_9ZZZZ
MIPLKTPGHLSDGTGLPQIQKGMLVREIPSTGGRALPQVSGVADTLRVKHPRPGYRQQAEIPDGLRRFE